MSNGVDPDKTAHYEPSHLDLRRLQKPIIIARGGERVRALLFLCRFFNDTRHPRHMEAARMHYAQMFVSLLKPRHVVHIT